MCKEEDNIFKLKESVVDFEIIKLIPMLEDMVIKQGPGILKDACKLQQLLVKSMRLPVGSAVKALQRLEVCNASNLGKLLGALASTSINYKVLGNLFKEDEPFYKIRELFKTIIDDYCDFNYIDKDHLKMWEAWSILIDLQEQWMSDMKEIGAGCYDWESNGDIDERCAKLLFIFKYQDNPIDLQGLKALAEKSVNQLDDSCLYVVTSRRYLTDNPLKFDVGELESMLVDLLGSMQRAQQIVEEIGMEINRPSSMGDLDLSTEKVVKITTLI